MSDIIRSQSEGGWQIKEDSGSQSKSLEKMTKSSNIKVQIFHDKKNSQSEAARESDSDSNEAKHNLFTFVDYFSNSSDCSDKTVSSDSSTTTKKIKTVTPFQVHVFQGIPCKYLGLR